MKYLKRTIEPQLQKAIKQFPAVAVIGARQTGKSTMLKHVFPEYNYVTFDDPEVLLALKTDPALFAANICPPVIIDEVQYAPEILPYIKIQIDKKQKNGDYIFTGSQIFTLMAGLTETLAGRIALFELWPFSFSELGEVPTRPLSCYKQILKGFYPRPNVQTTDLRFFYNGYLATYVERDVRQVQNVRDISVFQLFLQLLAARAGQLLNLQTIANDCGIAHATAKTWLSILESSRIVYLLKPYFRNITKRVIKTPKLHFADTGLLTFLLKYPDAETLMAGPAAGAVFENMIVMEALKNISNTGTGADIYFYRDSNKNEVDLIVDKGRAFDLYEIKSGKTIRPQMARNLKSMELKPSQKYILSFNENELVLVDGEVKAIPWWKMHIR
ncbi:MAG: ATP-binding protein [Treponema sp.]|nr:ATP-binding protein [Treponema sp.]